MPSVVNTFTMAAPPATAKRIAKDLAALADPAAGIWVRVVNDDLNYIYLMLRGPDDSPYEGALFWILIEPYHTGSDHEHGSSGPAYPFQPPRVTFFSHYSARCHPNLYELGVGMYGLPGGKICLSILGTWSGPGWAPVMTFSTIATTILSILDNEPLCNEPGYASSSASKSGAGSKHHAAVDEYTLFVRRMCLTQTVLRIIVPALQGGGSKSTGNVPGPGGQTLNFGTLFAEEIREHAVAWRDRYVKLLTDHADDPAGALPNCYSHGNGHDATLPTYAEALTALKAV